MLKKQKKQEKQSLITESEQSMTDIEKAVAAAPRAVAPVSHAPSPITEEEPEAKENDDETPESKDGETAEVETDKEDTKCTCAKCGDECQCKSSEGEEDAEESEEETEDEDETEVDMEEDVNALMNGEANLTEGFKSRAKTIFEAAVKSKVRTARKELHEGYQRKLGVKAEEILATVTEQVDSYLTYVVESWIKENQVAVDSTLRTEIAEGFITSLKNVFAENYIVVPKAAKDLV